MTKEYAMYMMRGDGEMCEVHLPDQELVRSSDEAWASFRRNFPRSNARTKEIDCQGLSEWTLKGKPLMRGYDEARWKRRSEFWDDLSLHDWLMKDANRAPRADGKGRVRGESRVGRAEPVASRSMKPEDVDVRLEAADKAAAVGNVALAAEILREVYLSDTKGGREVGLAIANDNEAMRWIVDYYDYIHWNERGMEEPASEYLLDGFIDAILDADYPQDYLIPDRDPKYAGKRQTELCERLMRLNKKYGKMAARYSRPTHYASANARGRAAVKIPGARR